MGNENGLFRILDNLQPTPPRMKLAAVVVPERSHIFCLWIITYLSGDTRVTLSEIGRERMSDGGGGTLLPRSSLWCL